MLKENQNQDCNGQGKRVKELWTRGFAKTTDRKGHV